MSLTDGRNVILETVKTLPLRPGVYRMLDAKGNVLYVGKAKSLKNRVRSYTLTDQLPVRLQRMVFATASMEIITTNTEVEALILESQLIKKLQPKYNILLKDDKAFPHIYIQKNHPFPQVYKKRGVNEAEAHCFGPFATIDAVDTTIIALQKIFKLRNCSDHFFSTRSRPCLQYHIKRCTAPCVNKVTEENYAQQTRQALDFLKGKSEDIQKQLKNKMVEASANESYELAAIYRDQIKDLHAIQQHANITPVGIKQADIIGIYELKGCVCIQVFFVRNGQNYGNRSYFPKHNMHNDLGEILQSFLLQFYESRPAVENIYLSCNITEQELVEGALMELNNNSKIKISVPVKGEKKKFMEHVLFNAETAARRKLLESAKQKDLLQELGAFLNMSEAPTKVEVYDNSHIQGKHSVGAFVVATDDGFEKKLYRKFTIKDESVFGDDFGMMREVFRRRFSKLNEEGWSVPDVVIIDGGKGQLSAVTAVLNELDLPSAPKLMAVAKGPDRNAGREKIFLPNSPMQQLDFNSPLLFFIQRLRDEAHRYVIETHRKKRSKTLNLSALDEIPGVGQKRKKALLHFFGSVKSIKEAAVKDLQQVDGISEDLASKIYSFFNPEQ